MIGTRISRHVSHQSLLGKAFEHGSLRRSFFLCAVAEHRDVATLGDHRVGRSSFGGNSCRGHGVRGYRLGGVVVVTGSSFPLPSCFCSRALDTLRSNQIERMNASCASLTNSLVQSILKSFSLSLVRDACPVFSRMPYVGFVRHGLQLDVVRIVGTGSTVTKLHDGVDDATGAGVAGDQRGVPTRTH